MAYKISIITVCFNAARTIERTIRSVVSQSYPDIEYIIVDGASTDDTLEIINKHSSRITRVISEKDEGIYDAMNKGLALATGDIINFLNADDYYCDGHVVENVVKAFESDSSRVLVYGDVQLMDAPPGMDDSRGYFSVKSVMDFMDHLICHQTAFAKRLLFVQIGGFNRRYKLAADFEWLIRAFKYRPSGFYELDRKLVCFSFVGRSHQQASTSLKEAAQIRLRHIPFHLLLWYYFRYVLIRGTKKKILNEK